MKLKQCYVILGIVQLIVWSSLSLADQTISFLLPSGVQVEIVEKPFQKSLFKITGCDGRTTCLINGRVPFGIDVELPKTFVSKINISYRSSVYSLDSSDMYNAWGNRPLEVKEGIRYFGGKCFDAKNCQFRGLFSDAAGSFVAEWKIVDGVSIRTVLTDSNDVTGLFLKYIDPPEYE
jgi:hypothetical protein